jgi:hypothetical protein
MPTAKGLCVSGSKSWYFMDEEPQLSSRM